MAMPSRVVVRVGNDGTFLAYFDAVGHGQKRGETDPILWVSDRGDNTI